MRTLFFLVCLSVSAAPAAAWNLVLPDTATAEGPEILLGEIAVGPVPQQAAGVVLQTQRKPGTVEAISRRMILRTLVTRGCAAGVRMSGADVVRVIATGKQVQAGTLRARIEAAVSERIPPAVPGAPASWVEVFIPERNVCIAGEPSVAVRDPRPLEPGRNQVQIEVRGGGRTDSLPVGVVLHCFAETATARTAIDRDRELHPDLFDWRWQDLAGIQGSPVLGRDGLEGNSSGRELAAGDVLRTPDLKPTPVVRIGDPVELVIRRGPVAATVRAFARQAGCLGQTIPVRNELTGRLVNARVTGPGLVEWRR